MHKSCFFLAVSVFTASAGEAQNSTTSCYSLGATVQCSTQANPGVDWDARRQQEQQNQQNLDQAFANIGAAIAARRERKREEKAALEAETAKAVMTAAVKSAFEADTAIELPIPTDEQAILLACTVNGSPTSLKLFEKHGRVDTTTGGVTRTRSAKFSTESVSWVTPLIRSSLNRLDGSYVGDGNIPEVEGQSITGTCALAAQRKF